MIKKLFSRNKEPVEEISQVEEVYCDDEIRNFITSWIERHDWKFENFADFLKLVGVAPLSS